MEEDHVIVASSLTHLHQPQLLTVLKVASWGQVWQLAICCNIVPALVSLVPGVIGTMQALEALKIMAGAGCILNYRI